MPRSSKRTNLARVTAGQRAGPIGDEAERVFEKWGAVGGFHVAKIQPDRQGLDRFFEFPPDPLRPGFGLDTRSHPVRALVQINGTQGAPGTGPALNLAIMERLVQLDMPCFVLGIELDAKLDPISARLAHVDEEETGRVLKELRALDAADAAVLQQFKYTLTWAKSDRIAPTAQAFLERAKRDVGDPASYAARKAAWRDRVGYGPRPVRLAFTLHATKSEIARAMMGETELDATVVSHTVVRFGIEQPVARDAISGKVRVSFEAPPGTPAVLRVHRPSGVAVVHGEIRLPNVPKALVDECPIRFAAPGLNVDLPSRMGLEQASVSFLPVASGVKVPLRESAAAARVFRGIVKEHAAMEIVIGDRSHDLRTIDTSLGPDHENLLNLVAGFEWAESVARDAGIPDDIVVERHDVERHLRALCLWAVYSGVASADQLTILFKTHPMVPTHRPLITVTTAALRLSGWVAARVLAFRDPAPKVRPGSTVAVRPQPHSSSPSRAVLRGRAPDIDVLAMADALEEQLKPLEPANSVLVEDHEHIQKIWDAVLSEP